MKKAFIIDLDNTIYPVSSIGDDLFDPLFELIKKSGIQAKEFEQIKFNIMRKPFQVVAAQFNFSQQLLDDGIELLKQLTYNKQMFAFEDYKILKTMNADRFLVTTGFKKMQQSKINQLNIENDFKEIHIVDPASTKKTKKDIFKEIMQIHHYALEEILVIGDDPESEIKAATELNMDTVLYDKNNLYTATVATYKINDFKELESLIRIG